jgi:two-component system, chemotaxis family, CheB/CheR fusion protein
MAGERAGPAPRGSARTHDVVRETRRPSADKPFRGRTILVVEDHEDALNVSRELLEHYGARVLLARNGSEGLKVLELEFPDLVLCDLRMPLMDGFEFMRQLRRSPRHSRLAVIAVSALGEYADVYQTWSAGFDGHLAKPVDVDVLVGAVKRVLWAHHRSRIRARRPELRKHD